MGYIENPKTKGSGIICCIPQASRCPNNCEDCFFQSGRSYLEPLEENLPNMPPDELVADHVVRVNDGNDSFINQALVIASTQHIQDKFYNTSIARDMDRYPGPVVLTLNPAGITDKNFWKLPDPVPENLMFVRFRTNMWNLELCVEAVDYYSTREIPIVLTFMAYYDKDLPVEYGKYYTFRKRTLNAYWAITTDAWELVMRLFEHSKWVYSCGKIEGELGTTLCRHCGNCLREYYATMERIKNGKAV